MENTNQEKSIEKRIDKGNSHIPVEVHVMAFDLGASNGRAIVGVYNQETIELHEVHRFSNDPVQLNQHIYWDFPRLFHELKTALVKAKNSGFSIKSVGIDSWGVDYGLIDEDGELMANPIHYRDTRAQQGLDKLLSLIDKDMLKKTTGMNCDSYNTINQLVSDKNIHRSSCKALVNMPDLFNYFLTGKLYSEFSMATTTQLYDYETMGWNIPLMKQLNFNTHLFQEIIPSGTIVGDVRQELLNELKIEPLKVTAITSHDTASAIGSVVDEDDFLFIATGTWIIVGSKQEKMTMNEHVITYNMTNEGAKYPQVNLMKNHVGLWIIQEAKRAWEKEGIEVTFAEMVEGARSISIDSYIDILDPRFFEPGDMPKKVREYCQETHQIVPMSRDEIVKVIEQSLAKQIAQTLAELEVAVGKHYTKVHLFGGGIQDSLLCDLIREYSGKEVLLGAKEATAFGNVLEQFIAVGAFTEGESKNILEKSLYAMNK